MSTRLDNNLEGPKPPDCEVMENHSNSKQHNNQTNGANTQDSEQHSTDSPPISTQDSVRPEASDKILTDFHTLKITCDKHFVNCIICKKGCPQLVRESTTGFATKLAVTCKNCKEKEKKMLNSISYFKTKINTMTINDIDKSQEKHGIQMKVRYHKKKLDI